MAESSEQGEQRLRNQACLLGSLAHAHITPVYELGKTDEGAVFVSVRKPQGQPLSDAEHAPIDAKQYDRAVSILITLCETLHFVHSKSILHADLKPEHIIVGRFGEIIISGWHNIRHLDDELTMDLPSGTPAFMAPEQAARSTLSYATDIYGLGSILYWLLSGKPPHDCTNAEEAILAAANKPPPFDHLIRDPELRAITQRALAINANERFESAQGLAEALRNWQELRTAHALITRAQDLAQPTSETINERNLRNAVHLYQDVAERWPHYPNIRSLAAEMRCRYSRQALSDGNFSAGIHMLRNETAEEKVLYTQITQEQQRRNNSQRNIRLLSITAAIIIIGCASAVIIIYAQAYVAWQAAQQHQTNTKQQLTLAEQTAKQEAATLHQAKHLRHAADIGLIRSQNNNELFYQAITLIHEAAETHGNSWALRRQLYRNQRYLQSGRLDIISHCLWSDTNTLILPRSNTEVAIYNFHTGDLLRSIQHTVGSLSWVHHHEGITYIAGQHGVQAYNEDTLTFSYREHPTSISSGSMSPNGKIAATGDLEGNVHLWDPQTGEQIAQAYMAHNHKQNRKISLIALSNMDILFTTDHYYSSASIDNLNNISKTIYLKNSIPGDLHNGNDKIALLGYGNGSIGSQFLNRNRGSRWFRINKGHQATDLSPSGRWSAAAAIDSNKVYTRSVYDGSQETSQIILPDTVYAISITPDDKHIIIADNNGWYSFRLAPFQNDHFFPTTDSASYHHSDGIVIQNHGHQLVNKDTFETYTLSHTVSQKLNYDQRIIPKKSCALDGNYSIHLKDSQTLELWHQGKPLTVLEKISKPGHGLYFDPAHDTLYIWVNDGILVLPSKPISSNDDRGTHEPTTNMG